MRLLWLFFLFASFWPWEQDPDQIRKSSLTLPPQLELLQILRVALFYEKPEVTLKAQGPYEMKGVPFLEPLGEGASSFSGVFRPDPEGIRVENRLHRVSGVRVSNFVRELEVENQKYRNAIRVLKNPQGSLTVVNEIEVEDYLKGVLPSEMKHEWPLEALKAQAVASRTYAIFKNIEHQEFPFTLGSDVGSQVYLGKSVERESTNRAVEATQGEILLYRGKIFPTFFHSTCGGHTTRADYQWRIESHPVLRGVECPYCRGSKFYSWKAEFSGAEIKTLLAKKGHALSQIQDLSAKGDDPSGRPKFFEVKHSEGSIEIHANDFRLALGADRMRSTKARIQKTEDGFLFRGRGWGHGVGMCQFGAKHLAELGYRYADILRYYYPGSELRNLEEVIPQAGRVPSGAVGKEGSFLKRWLQKAESFLEGI